jgi:hypothetical protein
MPRQRLLPHGQVDKPFVLSNEAFSAAEKVSSIKLTPAVKARVVLATMAFVANGQIEQSAPSLAVVHKIKRLLNLTKSLRQDFPDKNKEESPSDLDQTLRYILYSKEQINQLGVPFFLDRLSRTLERNQTLLENTLSFISKSDSNLTKGASWIFWIRVLTLIFRVAKLPTEIRRDQEGTSPFVAFVDAIQNAFPDHLKVLYKKRQLDALATAMSRATKGLPSDLDDKLVDNCLRVFIGAWKPLRDQSGLRYVVEPVADRFVTDILTEAGQL